MGLFAIHILTPSGKIVFDKIYTSGEETIDLVNRGLKAQIKKFLRSEKLLQAIEPHSEQVNTRNYLFRNFGDYVIILCSNNYIDTALISTIGWIFLRFISNYSIQEILSSNYDTNSFSNQLDEVLQQFGIKVAHENEKNLTTISILDLPLEYRPLALQLLTNPNYDIEDVGSFSELLDLPQQDVLRQIRYLKDNGYI